MMTLLENMVKQCGLWTLSASGSIILKLFCLVEYVLDILPQKNVKWNFKFEKFHKFT